MRRTELIDTSSKQTTLETCRNYIAARKSCYEFRSIRYQAVYEMLVNFGLVNQDTIYDVGAGDGEFGRYLNENEFRGNYVPVDGMLDGTDLNYWTPPRYAEFFVSIEVIEHLANPNRLLNNLKQYSTKAAIVTTPNPKIVNIFSMDKTHISAVHAEDFLKAGWKVTPQIFFVESEDSLLSWTTHNYTLGL